MPTLISQFQIDKLEAILNISSMDLLFEAPCEPIDFVGLEFDRICDSIECLRQFIPEIINFDLINVIYCKAGAKFNLSRLKFSQYILKHSQSFKIEDNELNTAALSEEERKAAQQLKIRENHIVARAFCLRDYGFAALQKEIAQNHEEIAIEENQYERIICRIIVEAFEILENYLCKEGMMASKTNKQQSGLMIQRAIQCRRMLAPQICEIFFKIIRGLYEIEPSGTVTKEEASILHKTLKRIAKVAKVDQSYRYTIKPLQNCLPNSERHTQYSMLVKQKNVEQRSKRRKQFKYQIHEKWTSSHEQFLLELYRQTPYISMIRDRFRQMFCEDSELFTVQSLKSILYRILRTAIKKLQFTIREHGVDKFSPMTTLDDNRVKMIIYNEDFREVRLLILEVYSRDYDLPLIVKTINKVNLLVSQSKNNYSTKRDKKKYDESCRRVKELCRNFQPGPKGSERCNDYNKWCSWKQLKLKVKDVAYARKGEIECEFSNPQPHADNQSDYQLAD